MDFTNAKHVDLKENVGSFNKRVGYISSLVKKSIDHTKAYGRATRPYTPIQGLVNNTYANIAEDDINERYKQYAIENQNRRKNKPQPGQTRTV